MRTLALVVLGLIVGGCGSFSGGLGGDSEKKSIFPFMSDSKPSRYSDAPRTGLSSARQYRRMTREAMEQESELHSQAGSMWISEGQGAWLFSQNKTRREGDVLAVQMDANAMKQIQTKVSVIKKLLKQLEEQVQSQQQQKLSQNSEKSNTEANRAPAAESKKEEAQDDLSDVQTITTRITERLPDGNYRVKGAQPLMIGKREFRVIVTGIIRPEDYNDQGVSSAKLIDPQYDVVSIRRKQGYETL
ncbi:MAG: flagellar basal body L-ring protein FlgH [Bdellovibrionaceae bacterium]|nr:flagellar basal body L-ring protein FlgH [Pseudobdellovibrionaceae bacterium]